MLAAMMAGSSRLSVDLIAAGHDNTNPWTVPGGVTSLTFYGSALGGLAGPNTVGGTHGGGGGGGAGWIHGVTLAVTPGDTLWCDLFGGGTNYYEVRTTALGLVCRVYYGATPVTRDGGRGGDAYWDATGASAFGANGGLSDGAAGSSATPTSVGGGAICGGGGGGAGNTISPSLAGGAGGGSGSLAGTAGVTHWGGGGAGVNPGGTRLTSLSETFQSAAFMRLVYG